MADSFSTNMKFQIQTPGGNNNSWGGIENNNWEEADDKFGDITSLSSSGGNSTLTEEQERVNAVHVSGTLVSNATIVFSGRGGTWVVKNATSGAFTVTCKVSGQTGVTVTQGDTRLVYYNGTDIAYATGSTDLVNDTSPQLGGDLDMNGNSIVDLLIVEGIGNATTALDYLRLLPTDWGRNKPGFYISKTTTADVWQIALYDGSDLNGLISFATVLAAVFKNDTGLGLLDSDSSHALQLKTSSNLSATRQLDLITGDANRSVTLAGNLNVSGTAEISGTHMGTHSGTSSGTNTGDQTVPSAASQAQQEAASATNVHTSPGTQHFHPGHPKAWVNFNGSGTIAINRDYGVSSITDNGTGDYTVNFDTAFSDANYGAMPSARHREDGAGDDVIIAPWASDAKTASAMQFHVWDEGNNVAFDSSEVSVFFAGDFS